MDPIEQMLTEVLNILGDGSNRVHIIDHLHFHDTKSGLKFHMYDNPEPFHITKFESGKAVAHMGDFIDNTKHMELFKQIKTKLISIYEPMAQSHRDNLLAIFNGTDQPAEPI